MKSFLISDNQDTLIGMRLAGIKGVLVKNREEALEQLQKTLDSSEIQIVIVTEAVLAMAEEEIMELKIKRDYPLIIEIPDRQGSRRGDYITKYIRESIGLKI
ncbi:MAG: V-type ATP synthase subunit F [Bacillota bacterium]